MNEGREGGLRRYREGKGQMNDGGKGGRERGRSVKRVGRKGEVSIVEERDEWRESMKGVG